MSRYKTPWEVRCQYRHQCPYLGGMSTKWCLHEYQRSHETEAEHWRVREYFQKERWELYKTIKRLETENEELKNRIKVLHQKQFKKNKKQPCSHTKKQLNNLSKLIHEKNKKRGAPKGHPGWFRKIPEKIDIRTNVASPQQCPHCHSEDLTKTDEKKSHIQEDIVLTSRTEVTEFIHEIAYCNRCRQYVIKTAENEIPNAHIGPVTKAAAVYLRYDLNIPYRKIKKLFQTFFGMRFVPATAMAFDDTAAKRGEALYDDIKDKIREAPIIHADETYWREDGQNKQLWYAGNSDLAFFHIDKHRSAKVATGILSDSFQGLLITDRYAAYNALNAKARQTCLAHVKTTVKEIKQLQLLKKEKNIPVIHFCDSITTLVKKVCAVGKKHMAGTLEAETVPVYIKRFYALLATICMKKLNVKKAENLRTRLMDKNKEYYQLFTFLNFPNAPPTNNHAEQSLRNPVIFRKISFGTRSETGSKNMSINMSLMRTAIRQGNHPVNFFYSLFTNDANKAQLALYNLPNRPKAIY